MERRSVTILLAPAVAGKTERVIQALAAPRQGRAILAAPSALHCRRLRTRLRPAPRLTVASFTGLALRLLRAVGERPQVASQATRTLMTRMALRAEAAAGRLPQFGHVATKPGFVAEVLRLIDSLRAAMIPPAALAEAGVSCYDGELAAMYRLYLEALDRSGLDDEHNVLARARDLVMTNPDLVRGLALFAVDGFDQLMPLQLSLVRVLADHAEQTLITLTGDGTERPAHHRFRTTLQRLRAALPTAKVEILSHQPRMAPALAHIERFLFSLDPTPPADAGGAVTIIGAPDREREVRAALRRVRAMVAAGLSPERIAILYQGDDLYPQLVREIAAEYSIPAALFEGSPLSAAPPGAALRALLELPLNGFPCRALAECWWRLGALSSSALQWSAATLPLSFTSAAALLDRLAHANQRLPWLRATLMTLARTVTSVGDDELQPPITAPEAEALLGILDAFVDWLDVPTTATPNAYIAWLRRLLGWQAGDASDDTTQSQAHPMLFPFTDEQRRALESLLSEWGHVAQRLNAPPIPFAEFVAELGMLLDAVRVGGEAPQVGKVAVLPLLAARGSEYDQVVILGVAEGAIPASPQEPPFYTRREWSLLVARGAAPPLDDPGDKRSLFYEAVTRARCGLTLTYTRLDEHGNLIRPSFYLHTLAGLFTAGVEEITIRASSLPSLGEAASPQEALIALIAGGSEQEAPGLPAELVRHVRHAIAVERQRESPAADGGPYEGVVTHPEALAALQHRFGPEYRWSATQINDYTLCPYRFAASHVLRLAPPSDPEDVLTPINKGRIYHAILARAGARWMRLGLPFDADHEAALLAALEAAAAEVLDAAPQTYGFEPDLFWAWERAEMQATLVRAVRRWVRDGAVRSGFRPVGVEKSFGVGRGAPPLRIATSEGEALVAGRIDRIDQDEQGHLALIDYKSGGTPRSLNAVLSGRDVQLTIYMLAAEELAAPGQTVAQAMYLMIGNGKRGCLLTLGERDQAEAALRERLAAAVAGSRTGRFPVRPTERCPPACAFAAICRVNLKT